MAYIAMFESLPFRSRIPNTETIEAMKEDRKNLKSYENLEELFKELEIKKNVKHHQPNLSY